MDKFQAQPLGLNVTRFYKHFHFDPLDLQGTYRAIGIESDVGICLSPIDTESSFELTENRQWSCPEVTGQIPEARDGHSACVYNGKMYIFGGYIDEETQFTQDVYALDLTSFHWCFIRTSVSERKYE